ncbi:MAG: putative methyltransferase [uncultured Thiotrichaceae bacterium]|uniref:tRNA (guanine(46)-N(7))-methyltransferase n=1 Tax=uncultured Thiotrichaceae bacterium TaxID=298394 RepID=A0A6S6U7V6_9GAMM|nr:MAG: putative methyltransferase [uncultured Thiotrichaceae bacterium]
MSRRSTEQGVRIVTSNQEGIHESLEDELIKHRNSAFRKPIADHTQKAFEAIANQITQHNVPIIFDSGCGTAHSTRHIANLYPDSLVIGIDRSQVRLEKNHEEALPENALIAQADLVDFWRLAHQENWQLQRNFILYPNPYPKSIHVKRRWHAHPVFPTLLSLGGILELRSNWKIYVDEFAVALQYSGYSHAKTQIYTPDVAWTLFEKKYHEDEQMLYQCKQDLCQS